MPPADQHPGPLLSIRHIREIGAVASASSLAEAGIRLGVSQSSLSRHIAQAERALGVALFERGWSGMALTDPGSAIIVHIDRMVAHFTDARLALEAAGARPADLGHRLDWGMFDVLEAVRTCGSASLAAQYLRISQPDVSRALAKIAATTGRAVFRRTHAGMAVTGDVMILADLHRRLLVEMDMLAQALEALLQARRHGAMTGRIIVGLLPFSEQDIVMRAFAQILVEHGDVRLRAMTGSYAMLTEGLSKGEIDFVLGPLRSPAPNPMLSEIHLHDETTTFIARADHPRARTAKTLRDLATESWVVGPPETPPRRFLQESLLDHGLPTPARICEITAFPLTEQMVLSSDAIGVATYSERKRQTMRPGLVALSVRNRSGLRKIGLTMRKDHAPSAAQVLFIDTLRAELG